MDNTRSQTETIKPYSTLVQVCVLVGVLATSAAITAWHMAQTRAESIALAAKYAEQEKIDQAYFAEQKSRAGALQEACGALSDTTAAFLTSYTTPTVLEQVREQLKSHPERCTRVASVAGVLANASFYRMYTSNKQHIVSEILVTATMGDTDMGPN